MGSSFLHSIPFVCQYADLRRTYLSTYIEKVRAIEDVDVTVPMTATPRPKCDKIPALASTITTTAAIALPHPSQNSQTSSSESEYSNELSEVSSQTDSASEPSTREFPVTPRNDQSPQSSYDFDSAPYDNNYEASVFGGVACGKEVYKELELDGEELEGNGMYAQSVESFEYEADPLGVGAWFGVSCDEEGDEYDHDEYEYEDDGVFEGPVDEEPDADTYEIEPVSGYYLEVKCVKLIIGDMVRVAPECRPGLRAIIPEVVGAVAGVDY